MTRWRTGAVELCAYGLLTTGVLVLSGLAVASFMFAAMQTAEWLSVRDTGQAYAAAYATSHNPEGTIDEPVVATATDARPDPRDADRTFHEIYGSFIGGR